MVAIAGDASPLRRESDRNAFLILVGCVWFGVVSGFGVDSFHHVRAHGLDYPLIVHVHALTFVGWLVLFTTQIVLIREGRFALHRRLGIAGAFFATWMMVIGPATAIVADAARHAKTGETPEFLSVQFTDIITFGGLTAAALLLRKDRIAHKRLMLLGLFYIADAGFARFFNDLVMTPFGDGRLAEFGQLYLGSDLLVLALGIYDLVRHRRIYPVYIAGVVYILAMQLLGSSLLHSDGWKAFTLRLIGA